jgi:hypothetical protein
LPAVTTVTTRYGSAIVPAPITPVWLTGVKFVHEPRLSVLVPSWLKKSGA